MSIFHWAKCKRGLTFASKSATLYAQSNTTPHKLRRKEGIALNKKRISFFMKIEDLRELGRLKQDLFFDKTWSELYREIFLRGMKELRKEAK